MQVSRTNLFWWGIGALILCLIVIAVGALIPYGIGTALVAVAVILKPFAIIAAAIGAVIWLLTAIGLLR